MIIYKITNKRNGKSYVGQTKRGLDSRWRGHCRSSKNNKSNNLFHNAIKKHGPDAFEMKIIDFANSIEELDKLEKKYIEEHNTLHPNGYNTKTGGNTPYYSKLSKSKMRVAKLGSKVSQTTRNKMSESHKKRWEDEELRKKRSNISKNQWKDKGYRSAISKARKQYWANEDNRKEASARMLKVLNNKDIRTKISDRVKESRLRMDVQENIDRAIKRQQKQIVDSNGVVYESLKDAADALGVQSSNICKVLKGVNKKCKGLHFKYVDSKPLVYMVIGVSGSGKSWVCKKLLDKYEYVAYDASRRESHFSLILEASKSGKPVLYDPVIGISTTIKRYKHMFDIKVVAILEPIDVVESRLKSRGGKMKDSIRTRHRIIQRRAESYAAFSGTSQEVLDYLRSVI